MLFLVCLSESSGLTLSEMRLSFSATLLLAATVALWCGSVASLCTPGLAKRRLAPLSVGNLFTQLFPERDVNKKTPAMSPSSPPPSKEQAAKDAAVLKQAGCHHSGEDDVVPTVQLSRALLVRNALDDLENFELGVDDKVARVDTLENMGMLGFACGHARRIQSMNWRKGLEECD